MKRLTAAFTTSLVTLACMLISACSSEVEQVQTHKSPQRTLSTSIVSTLETSTQESRLLRYDSSKGRVSTRSETYVF